MEESLSREEKIVLLHSLYGWNVEQLSKHNDSQLETLVSACKDEEGNLRRKQD